MKKRSLKNFTFRHLLVAILGIIAVWAASFYWLIIEEVYDNIDDGLKDSRLRIIREAESNPDILNIAQYGVSQFKITPLADGRYSKEVHIYNSSIFMPYDNDDEPVRILQTIFSHQGKYYQLEIYTSTVEEDELLEDLLTALLFLYFALTGSILLINHFVLKKAWSPFYLILERMKKYQIGSKAGFQKTNAVIREFDQLEEEVSEMVQRNERIYEQQNQFIGNAAHELQTPLAIAGNKLELLIEDKDINAAQAKKISEITELLNRLKRLNKSLLTLSKIENEQFSAIETLNFNKLIHQCLSDFESLTTFKKIDVSVEEAGIFEFGINSDLAGMLLNNLLKNAIVHNAPNGYLRILIDSDSISIHNPGKFPLHSHQIFERFYKGQQSEHSTGLGLSIVKSIVNLYPNLFIAYRFDNEHIFELTKQP